MLALATFPTRSDKVIYFSFIELGLLTVILSVSNSYSFLHIATLFLFRATHSLSLHGCSVLATSASISAIVAPFVSSHTCAILQTSVERTCFIVIPCYLLDHANCVIIRMLDTPTSVTP